MGSACLLVGVVGLVLLFCFFIVADQSLRSSCLPMTILAQLHDCHSCYDERSIVQKKKACGATLVADRIGSAFIRDETNHQIKSWFGRAFSL